MRTPILTIVAAGMLAGGPAHATVIEFAGQGTFTSSALNQAGVAITAERQETVNYAALGTFQAPSVSSGGIVASGSNTLNVLNFNGLGVVGGSSDNTLDSNESVRFQFASGARRRVSYRPFLVGDRNANGLLGEATVEAFGASGQSLGSVRTDGLSTKDLSAAFGADIAAFSVQALGPDVQRIGTVSYLDDALLNLLQFNGLGVVGGTSDNTIDNDEAVVFDFGNLGADAVTYRPFLVGDRNGNGLLGEAAIEAFDLGGASLGVNLVAGLDVKDVSALYGGQRIARFSVTAQGPDIQRIGTLGFDLASAAPPLPATGTATQIQLGLGLVMLALAGCRRRLRRSR